MPTNVIVKMNHSGSRALLRSFEIQADLKWRAERIADAAGPGMEVRVRGGRQRARASVTTSTIEARRAEARDRVLTRAIDAGRG